MKKRDGLPDRKKITTMILSMPRKEPNAEVLHCWKEQVESAQEIVTLKAKIKKAIQLLAPVGEALLERNEFGIASGVAAALKELEGG